MSDEIFGNNERFSGHFQAKKSQLNPCESLRQFRIFDEGGARVKNSELPKRFTRMKLTILVWKCMENLELLLKIET